MGTRDGPPQFWTLIEVPIAKKRSIACFIAFAARAETPSELSDALPLEGWTVVESLVGGLLKRATITAHGELDADAPTPSS